MLRVNYMVDFGKLWSNSGLFRLKIDQYLPVSIFGLIESANNVTDRTFNHGAAATATATTITAVAAAIVTPIIIILFNQLSLVSSSSCHPSLIKVLINLSM